MTPGLTRFRSITPTLLAFALASGLLSACTPSCGKSAQQDASNPSTAPQHSLAFELESTVEVLLAKADPASGDAWTARFIRSARPGATLKDWEIQLGPEGRPLLDRKANGGFLIHVLDTLRAIQVSNAPLSGPPESFGLTTPRFQIKWKARPKGSEVLQDFEIRLGAPTDNTSDAGVYGWIAPFDPSEVKVFRGAALAMLSRIENFQTLRQMSWSALDADDVDEIEIRNGAGKPLRFYAQREGGAWTNERHIPWKKDVGAVLERFAHLRIREFVDNEDVAKKLRPLIERQAPVEVTFKDRKGNPTVFRVARIKIDQVTGLFGTVSSRPDAVFLLHEETLNVVRAFY